MVRIKILKDFSSHVLGNCEKYEIRECKLSLAESLAQNGLVSIIKDRLERPIDTKPAPLEEMETKHVRFTDLS